MSACDKRRPRVVLGLTGSVASVKWPALVRELAVFADVCVVATERGVFFARLARGYDAEAWDALAASDAAATTPLLTDEAEWASYAVVGRDSVPHIELRKWADVLVVAPLSAHSLSLLATGAAPSLLSCVARAWDIRGAPLVIAPAMNSLMWSHPATAAALAALEGWGARVVSPATRRLACGDVGTGAMASIADVVAAVRAACAELALSGSGQGEIGGAARLPEAALDEQASLAAAMRAGGRLLPPAPPRPPLCPACIASDARERGSAFVRGFALGVGVSVGALLVLAALAAVCSAVRATTPSAVKGRALR